MTLNEKIEMMYKQYKKTKSISAKKDLYKAIKRAEGKRRKRILQQNNVVV